MLGVETHAFTLELTVEQAGTIKTIEAGILHRFPSGTTLLRWAIVGKAVGTAPSSLANNCCSYQIEATVSVS